MSIILRTALAFAFFLLATPFADAASRTPNERINSLKAELSIVRDGKTLPVNQTSEDALVKRIVDLFNAHITSTEKDSVLKQKFKRDGLTLNEKWLKLKQTGSYFFLSYENKNSDSKKPDNADIEEVMVTFHEDANQKPFGLVLAKTRGGTVKGYETSTRLLTNLYCYENAIKYLPEHYTKMHEKYSAPEFKDSGVSCSKERDAYLEEKRERQKAKDAKWKKKRGPYGR